MEYARLLHPNKFDARINRFTSVAFKNSSGNSGVSVIDCECVRATGSEICDHARAYYASQTGEPPIYWKFDDSILPATYRIAKKTSPSGDICHRNIHDVPDGVLRDIFVRRSLSDFLICAAGGSRPLMRSDLPT